MLMFNYIAFSLALISLVLGAGLLLKSKVHADKGTILPMVIGYLVVIISALTLVLAVFCGYKRFEVTKIWLSQVHPQFEKSTVSGCPFTLLPAIGGAEFMQSQFAPAMEMKNKKQMMDEMMMQHQMLHNKMMRDMMMQKMQEKMSGNMQQTPQTSSGSKDQTMPMNQNVKSAPANESNVNAGVQTNQTTSQATPAVTGNKPIAI